jgi:hypothetical protein
MFRQLGVLCVSVCLPAALLADFSYQQSTKITGGAMVSMLKIAGAFSKQAREPIEGTVSVKGNKMTHTSKDRADIIDLDSETFTGIDFSKKTYTVMTFAEMAQMMERTMQQMKDKKNGDASFKISLKSTGATKQVNGYDAKEMLMTFNMEATDPKSGQKGGMLVTSNMWIAQNVAGYEEMREFHKKMATKLAWTPGGGGMMAANPDMARGMAEIYKEAAKMDGVPVLQIMRMTPAGPDGQPIQTTETQSSQQQSKPKAETPSIGNVLGGRLGGFGGLGRKKKQQEEPKEEPAAAATTAPAGDATLAEITTEMSGFSSASVDASKFVVPAGFKKVDSPAARQTR